MRLIRIAVIPLLVLTSITAVAQAGAQVDPTTTAPPAPPPPEPAPPAVAPPAVPAPTGIDLVGPELRAGATGREVALFQIRLVEKGFWLDERLGKFGESTRHAVVAYQKYMGLPRTGRINTWTRIGLGASTDRSTPRQGLNGHTLDVDLGRQILIAQTNGRTDWIFDVSTGTRKTPTPRGRFKIQRQISGVRHSKLGVLYSPKYFTGGYAIHGSPSVPASPASHGCVRVTNQAINFIWGAHLADIGTPLTVL